MIMHESGTTTALVYLRGIQVKKDEMRQIAGFCWIYSNIKFAQWVAHFVRDLCRFCGIAIIGKILIKLSIDENTTNVMSF